jgi:hypothetical protein
MPIAPINLYFQAVVAVENYSEGDVLELLSVCSDSEKIKINQYVNEYLASPTFKHRSLRSQNDRIVIAIAVLFDKAARKSKKRFSLQPVS